MEIKIRSLGGIEHADLSVGRVALVTGPNGAGKSSILRAVGAALARDPGAGLAKKLATGMVRAGSEKGGVQILSAEGSVKLAYPKGDPLTDGAKPPQSSPYAAGLIDVLTLAEKDRVSVMASYLGAVPVIDDLRRALADQSIPDAYVAPVWASIEEHGWDAAHSRAKDKGANLKGQWEATTGENYGSAKAAKWLPAGWSDVLGAQSVEILTAESAAARTALEQAIGLQAVRADDMERLKASAARVPELVTALEAAQKKVEEAKMAFTSAEAYLKVLPAAAEIGGLACPHCQKPIRIKRPNPATIELEAMEEAPKQTAAALKKQREERITAEGSVDRTRGAWNDARLAYQRAEQDLDTAKADQERLEEAGETAARTGALDLERAREAARAAEAALEAFKKKADADRLAAGIAVNQALVHILAGDGLRKAVLSRAVEKFNTERLDPIAQSAGWGPIDVQPDLSISYRGRSAFLSGGECYRVRAALAVAFAQIDGSQLVVLDGADILDGPGRNGLIRMVLKAGVPALIGMTYAKAQDAPDLSNVGGCTYWVEGAQARPLIGEKALAG